MPSARRARLWGSSLVVAALALGLGRGSALRVGDAPTLEDGRPCTADGRWHGRCHPRPAVPVQQAPGTAGAAPSSSAVARAVAAPPSSGAVHAAVPAVASTPTARGTAATAGAAPSSSDGQYFDCSASAEFLVAFEREPEEALQYWSCGDLDAAVFNSRRTVATIGDSTTHGLNVSRGEEYPSVLHLLLNKQFPKQFNVINLGVTASTARHKGNHSYWEMPQWSIAAEIRIDIAIVMLGINDAGGKNWAKEEYVQDYLKMVQEILRVHPNATIFVAVPPQGAYAFHASRLTGEVKRTRRDLASAVEAVRREAHLETPAINFYDAFAYATGLMPGAVVQHAGPSLTVDEMYLKDGIHPSALGYNEMAVAASAAVSKDAMSPRGFCLRCQATAHPDLCEKFCSSRGHATR